MNIYNFDSQSTMTMKKLSILTSIILTSAILGFSMQGNIAYATTSEIGDTVFHDINNNGVQDSEDPGIAGVTIELKDVHGTVIDTISTDGDGMYLIEFLTPGIYTVSVVEDTIPIGLGSGMCPTLFDIELLTGESFLDADFCYTNSDVEPPVITLIGANPQELLLDESYTELGATVIDNSGETIIATIDASQVITTTPGNYFVSYNAEDSSGNMATTVFRTVVVLTQEESIQRIIDELNEQVDTGDIGNQTTALMNKLNQILAKFDAGNVNSACNQLDAFVNQINSLVNTGTLTQAEAQPILDTAEQITLSYC